MRTSKRAKSAVAVVSMVMAVSMMLGGFNAFADGESDWLKTNQDQGPVSSEINLLKKDKEDLQPQGDGDNNESDSAEAQDTPLGVSGFQIGYSQPPLGYSMTITYDAYTEPDDPAELPLGYSVLVNDGDEVPEDTELLVVVEADIDQGASPFFDVLVNDEPLDNDLADEVEALFSDAAEDLDDDDTGDDDFSYTVRVFGSGDDDTADPPTQAEAVYEDLDPDEQAVARASAAGTLSFGEPIPFQATFTPEEDSVVSIEGMLFSPIAPMTWSGTTITVDSNSTTLTTFNRGTVGGNGTVANPFTCTYTCENSGCTVTVPYSGTTYPNATTTSAGHTHIVCDVNRWHASYGGGTLNVVFGSTGGGAAAANSTTALFTAITAVVNKPSTLNFTGYAPYTGPTISRQPNGSINLATAIGVTTSNVTFDNVNVDISGAVSISGKTVTFNNMVTAGTFTPTGVISGGGSVTVSDGGTLAGNGVKLNGNNITVSGSNTTVTTRATLSNNNITDAGTITLGTAGNPNGASIISGSVSGNSTGTVNSGTVSGTMECSGAIGITNVSVSAAGTIRSTGSDITMNGGSVAGTGGTTGRLEALNGDVAINAGAGDVNRINAKTANIASGYTGTINVIRLRGATADTTYIDGGSPTAKVYVGGTTVVVGSIAAPQITSIYLGDENANVGNTTVSTLDVQSGTIGNIYGGTDTTGNTVYENDIQINGGTISDSVYGGSTGNGGGGDVGKAKITINDGIVTNNIYGGANNGSTVGASEVNYDGGEITNGSIHGGGIAGTVNAAVVNINSPITRTELPVGHIYGNGTGSSAGRTEINILDFVTGINIYGGSNGNDGDVTTDGTYIDIGAAVQGNVYGGSNGSAGVTGTNGTNITNGNTVTGNVYGGNTSGGSVAKVTILNNGSVTGSSAGRIFGGNSSGGTVSNGITITNATGSSVARGIFGTNETGGFTVSDGGVTISNDGNVAAGGIHGGSLSSAGGTINGGVNITNGGTVADNIYGGSAAGVVATAVNGTVTGSSKSVVIQNNSATLVSSIYGGNQDGLFSAANGVLIDNNANMTGDIFGGNEAGSFLVNAQGVKIENDSDITGSIYGGSEAGASSIAGGVYIEVTAGLANAIYGGNKGDNITVSSGGVRIENAGTIGVIYGGSEAGSSVGITGGVSITNTGASTNGIFGGSKSTTAANTITNGVTIQNNGTGTVGAPGIYGGNSDAAGGTNTITNGVSITNNASVTGGIYGGTKAGTYTINGTGTTVYGVNIVNTGTVGTEGIFGGSGSVTPAYAGTTTINNGVSVTNSGAVTGDIYGGGYNGTNNIAAYTGTNGTGTLVTNQGASSVTGDIYGGNAPGSAGAVASTKVQVTGGTLGVTMPVPSGGNVFGGGHGNGTVGSNSVTGNANVIVSGGNLVSGTVFGGGRNGSTTGSTTVNVGVDIIPGLNVYGGGEDSPIVYRANANNQRGDTYIEIDDAASIDNVFAGGTGTNATVDGNTTAVINATGAVIRQNVYGGGEFDTNNVGVRSNDKKVATVDIIDGTVQGSVYGGGFNSTADTTDVKVTANVNTNVYGGGQTTTNPADIRNDSPAASPATKVELDAGAIIGLAGTNGNVFGGGTDVDNSGSSTGLTTAPINGDTQVTIAAGQVGHNSTVDMTASVYGGGENNTVTGTTNVLMTGGVVHRDVFGGGLYTGGTVNSAGNTSVVSTVTISDGTVHGGVDDTGSTMNLTTDYNQTGGGVYGGGYKNATINGSTEVLIDGYADIRTSVYGGGLENAIVTGDTKVTVDDDAIITWNVYGGGRESSHVQGTNGTRVEILDGKVHHNVYGGGLDGANVISDTYVQIDSVVGTVAPSGRPSTNPGGSWPIGTGAASGDVVFGGGTGAIPTTVGGSTRIVVGQTPDANANINADVHGGGDGIGNNIQGADGTHIEIIQGTITGNVFGGGHDSAVQKTRIDHKATINGSIWGGGVSRTTSNANVTTAGVIINLDGGTVTSTMPGNGNVNGGGVSTASQLANITSNTQPAVDITIQGGSDVAGTVYGGGEAWTANGRADINQDVKILIHSSRIRTDVFGGGHHDGSTVTPLQATILRDVDITLDGTTQIDGNVYGGGLDNRIVREVKIVSKGSATISGTLHGGGKGTASTNADDARVNDTANNEAVVITITLDENTHIVGNVYGGGDFGHVYGSIKLDVLSGKYDSNIYGGGQNGDVEWNTFVLVEKESTVGHSVYGGGIFDDIIARPFPANDSNTYTVGGYTDVTINGEIKGSVYGGGHRMDVLNNGNHADKGTVVRITTAAVVGDSAPPSDTDERGTVYGGGRDANIANANFGGTFVYLNGDAKVYWDVYGGGWNETGNPGDHGNVAGPLGTFVQLNDDSWVNHNVYGGGRNFGDVTHVNAGGTVIELNDRCKVGNPTSSPRDTKGDVFGGGNEGHIWGINGTKVTLNPDAIVYGTIYGGCYYADVKHPNAGTQVYIYGQVGDDYHVPTTGAIDDPDPRGYPRYYDYTGNVYGGGHHGNIIGSKGTYLIVTDIGAEHKAVVYNDVFGGGFEGEVMYDTVVIINNGGEVYRSVFGGGQQWDTTNPTAAHVHGTTNVTVEDRGTKVGHPNITDLNENISFVDKVENELLEYHAGRIFGGGDFATVGGTANVTVDDLGQLAYRTISGGSFGVHSVNTVRNVTLRTLGTGEGLAKVYDDLRYYTVIKHLQDYTLAEVYDSYLTVYYHLRSVDDGSYNGLEYRPDYYNEYLTFGGKYHPWRPYPHKDIIVEPNLRFDSTFFRMEGGYTIDMRRGSIMSVNPDPVELLIDRFDGTSRLIPPREHEDRLTATSKLYGPDDNIVSQGVFAYNYLPVTAFPTDLNDRTSFAINGINMYIPPTDVRSVKGNSTNHGGSTDTDWTTGNHGAPQQLEATDHTVSVRATQASQQELLNKVQAAVQKTALGKTAYVSENRYDTITGGILSALGKAAARDNGNLILMADTMNGNSVQGRLYLNPNLFPSDQTLNLRVYTTSDQVAQAKANFQQYYSNEFAFVKLGQTDPFGTEVEIAAKVSLGNLDTENLIFYAYSESTNSYRRIENPRYFIDKNGYLHFHTAVGGTMVITDTPLARR